VILRPAKRNILIATDSILLIGALWLSFSLRLHIQDDLIILRTEHGVDKLMPGLTGWAQVNGRDELPIPQKVALDVEYVQKQSFWFDVEILWLTFLKVLQRDGVSH
jgi:lipopolysaccharide/colanic/teichoic acid biosynthesis glycosyltransferase